MRKFQWFWLGALTAFAVLLAGGLIGLSKAHGFSARERPTVLERWIAGRARSAALARDVFSRNNPVTNTAGVLIEARAHWADHCAMCHANDGSGDTEMGKHTYPPAPDMRLPATQEKTDGELFYVIENGIRLSAMPAWGGSGHEEDSWKLVHFIRHLPRLTFEEKKEMEKLNPKGPEDRKEEEEEEKFLRGEEIHEQPTEHHHH